MNLKLVGSMLLIVGTSIGAGMLALPIATAQLGFVGSMLLYLVIWLIMTSGAFLALEVNLWLPQNSNFISMAKSTLGKGGAFIAWIVYLFLLYSLLCAYVSGGSDLLQNLTAKLGIKIPVWLASVCFITLFGFVVYLGIKSVDYLNRGLMFIKLGALFLLIALLIPNVSTTKLVTLDFNSITNITALTVTVTSFGYSILVPSLRVYYNDNIQELRKVIIIGSLIPLFCYLGWDLAIMGNIPLIGEHSLSSILNSTNPNSKLVDTLNMAVERKSVSYFVNVFTSICVVTSFLGVSLCLVDFLVDGLNFNTDNSTKKTNRILIHLITFLPPLLIVLFYPGIFMRALEYAGIYCVILLVLFPALMVWRGRYHLNIANGYQVFGGKIIPGILMIFSIVMISGSLKFI